MSPTPALLRFLQDEILHADVLAERCAAGTVTVLRDAPAGPDREAAFNAAHTLHRQTPLFVDGFSKSLRRSITEELNDAPTDSPAAGLELLDEDRIEVDIELSRALQLIDATAEWELRELQTFTSTLAGLDHVSADSNPLRPMVYATALWDAACAIVTARPQQTLLLRTSAGVLAGLLKTAWAAAASRLEAQGVQPGLYKTIVLAPNVGERGAGTPASPAAANELPELRMAASPVPEGPAQAQVFQRLARLFALMQVDAQVPATYRATIARLQIAAFGLAVQEPGLLEQRHHAMWRLIDTMAQAGAAYPAPGDPRETALRGCCEAVAEEVVRSAGATADPGADAATLRRADARLQAFLAEQWQQQLQDAQPAVAALSRHERREALELRLSQRLVEQLGPITTPPAVRRFVTGTWARVIAESMLEHGEQAEATQARLKAVDDLLWSLQTPDHPKSRKRLVAMLPGLLRQLRSGMEAIALPQAEQQAFLDALMTVHTDALRPAQRLDGDLTPQQIVQRLREEVVDPRAGVQPFADSVIDIASLDTVPAELLQPQEGREHAAARLAAIEPGTRLRLFLHGRAQRVQLLWRSEQGLYLLFAGEQHGRTHSLTRRALERLDAAGLVQAFEDRPLVQRTLDALRQGLAAPA